METRGAYVYDNRFKAIQMSQPRKITKKRMESPYEINESSEKRFYEGFINKSFRVYSYFQEGLNHLERFKTIAYFLIGFGLIFNVSQESYGLLALVGVAVSPPILWFGYIMATRGNRSLEYFRIRDLSPYGKYNIQIQEKQTNDIEEILEELKKINKRK